MTQFDSSDLHLFGMDTLVNAKLYLLALATTVLLHPCVAHAQPNSAGVRTHTYTYPDTPHRGPNWGFTIAMSPGPGNSYNYSYVRSVVTGSAAQEAGLMVGDTIVAVDGRDVRAAVLFPVQAAGMRYVILVRRGAEELELIYTFPKTEESPRREDPADPGN